MPTEHAQMHAGEVWKVVKVRTLRGKGKLGNGKGVYLNNLIMKVNH